MAVAQLIAVVSVALGAIAVPEKTAVVGESANKGRIEVVGKFRQAIDALSQGKNPYMPADIATGLKQDLALLRRKSTHGWSSIAEISALRRVIAGVGKYGTIALGDRIEAKADELADKLDGVLEKFSDDTKKK